MFPLAHGDSSNSVDENAPAGQPSEVSFKLPRLNAVAPNSAAHPVRVSHCLCLKDEPMLRSHFDRSQITLSQIASPQEIPETTAMRAIHDNGMMCVLQGTGAGTCDTDTVRRGRMPTAWWCH